VKIAAPRCAAGSRARCCPGLARRPGIASAHLFTASVAAPVTREQQIRGRDAGLDCAVPASGYGNDVVASLAERELQPKRLSARGAGSASTSSGLPGVLPAAPAGP